MVASATERWTWRRSLWHTCCRRLLGRCANEARLWSCPKIALAFVLDSSSRCRSQGTLVTGPRRTVDGSADILLLLGILARMTDTIHHLLTGVTLSSYNMPQCCQSKYPFWNRRNRWLCWMDRQQGCPPRYCTVAVARCISQIAQLHRSVFPICATMQRDPSYRESYNPSPNTFHST